MQDFEIFITKLLDRLNDHDLLIEVANNQKNMIKTMGDFIQTADTRMGRLEERHRTLELRVNAGFAGLAVIMYLINHFVKS